MKPRKSVYFKYNNDDKLSNQQVYNLSKLFTKQDKRHRCCRLGSPVYIRSLHYADQSVKKPTLVLRFHLNH